MSLCNSISPDAGRTVVKPYTGPRLHELPPEIRCMIYHHVFASLTMRLAGPGQRDCTYCSIRGTCKALNADPYLEDEMLRSSTIVIANRLELTSLKTRLRFRKMSYIRRISVDTSWRDYLVYHHICSTVSTPKSRSVVRDLLDLSSRLQTLTVRLTINGMGTHSTRHVFDYAFKDLCAIYDCKNSDSILDPSGHLRLLEGHKALVEWYRQPFRHPSARSHNQMLELDRAHAIRPFLFQYTFLRSYHANSPKFGARWFDELVKGAAARGIEIFYEFQLYFLTAPGSCLNLATISGHPANGNSWRPTYSDPWELMDATVSTKDWTMRVKDGGGKIWEFKQHPLC